MNGNTIAIPGVSGDCVYTFYDVPDDRPETSGYFNRRTAVDTQAQARAHKALQVALKPCCWRCRSHATNHATGSASCRHKQLMRSFTGIKAPSRETVDNAYKAWIYARDYQTETAIAA